jgi:predicted O-methyltransferase YrrM
MKLKALEILENKGFKTADGKWAEFTSAIDAEEVLFLNKLIKQFNPKTTMEIGCAEGVSSLTICESIAPDAHHTIVDPNQSTQWERKGINNLKAAGFNNFSLVEEYSEFAMPQFLKEGKKFDFIFVDGWHTMDHVMVEFFYINRILPVGGIVVFDDAALAGLNKLMRYISNYPNFKPLGCTGHLEITPQRKVLNVMKRIVSALFFFLPERVRRELLNDTVVRTDEKLQINGSVVAFQKTAEDNRGWAWFEMF